MNSRQNLASSSILMCIEGSSSDQAPRKLTVFWGDPADVGIDNISHCSHPHPLYQFKLEIQDDIECKICGLLINGFAHGYEDCEFFIHDEKCLEFKTQIIHKSHPAHPLELRPPSNHNMCDACLSPTNTPFYRCCICDCDLHLNCGKLPEMGHDKHRNLIRLYYSFPHWASARCSVCNAGISKRGWLRYNRDTGYTTQLKCAPPQIVDMQVEFFHCVMAYLVKRKSKVNKKNGRFSRLS